MTHRLAAVQKCNGPANCQFDKSIKGCGSHLQTPNMINSAQDYQRLLASAPARRLNPAQLAQSSVLKNKLVDIIAFLENLAVKDGQEKDLFFKQLPTAIPSLPLPLAQRKLLPMLASKQGLPSIWQQAPDSCENMSVAHDSCLSETGARMHASRGCRTTELVCAPGGPLHAAAAWYTLTGVRQTVCMMS